jgi:hypothetical protein
MGGEGVPTGRRLPGRVLFPTVLADYEGTRAPQDFFAVHGNKLALGKSLELGEEVLFGPKLVRREGRWEAQSLQRLHFGHSFL